MSDTPNPFKTPENAADVHAEPEATNYDLRGMLILIAVSVALVAFETFVNGLSVTLVFVPPILFFAVAFWSVFAGMRATNKSQGLRIGLSLLAGIVAVPCCQCLLMFTCIPATTAIGSGFDLHNGVTSEMGFTAVSSLLLAGIALLALFLVYLLPQSLRRSNKAAVEYKSQRVSDKSVSGKNVSENPIE
ncbi:hypothetical protein [Mariniblastus fucicola]|uniref:Uncharacterized protein n=1 Tax=Mariniblastus fucicola TaxID=980251 RepID=A0A5B9PD49_9BACT|nr:hypothetical protein [Mariniblastus fucicola]QEG24234.1 hypothetical protein MFFC18_41510 [Mariniblastus fucicola]